MLGVSLWAFPSWYFCRIEFGVRLISEQAFPYGRASENSHESVLKEGGNDTLGRNRNPGHRKASCPCGENVSRICLSHKRISLLAHKRISLLAHKRISLLAHKRFSLLAHSLLANKSVSTLVYGLHISLLAH